MPPLEPAQLWPMALAAILNERNKDDHDVLGGSLRPRHALRTTFILARWWNVRTGAEALSAIDWLMETGHRTSLAEEGEGSPESFLAWDLCRSVAVAGHAFVSYLLDRDTAWALILRSAKVMQASFSSFAEVGQSYLRGLRTWADEGSDTVKNSEAALAKLLGQETGPFRLPWSTPLDGAPAPSVDQRIVHVRPGGTIAEAIEASESGDRIVVPAGSYAESIRSNHSVEIVAAGDGPVFVTGDGSPTVWVKAKVSVSLRGLTLLSSRTAEGKSLNTTSVPGGYLRLHECTVAASHHAVSVRDEGFVLLSKSTVEATGQSGVWCEGASVAVVDSAIHDAGAHGVYVGKGTFASVLERCTIARAKEAALFAEAEVRATRLSIEEPGKYGVVAQGAPVSMTDCAVRGSKGWGATVKKGARLMLLRCTVERSQGANLDAKDARVHVESSIIARGHTSGVTLQEGARATFVESKVEDNAQGNVFTLPGATLIAAASAVRGEGPAVFLQGAKATLVRTVLEGSPAIDARAGTEAAFVGCPTTGEAVVRAGSRARFASCAMAPPPVSDDGGDVTVEDGVDVDAELARLTGG